ncbi:MAG TPA: hypothetical protein PK413_15715, partial [Thermoanaerobaculia bacterium]|nr:hypothetical protein [Thermoanaerobaculia bacterium]
GGPAGQLWSDLARAQPVFGDGSTPVEPSGVLEDLLVLPPVPAELSTWREEVAGRHLERGTPLLLQLLPGEPLPALEATVVFDLLGALVRGDHEAFDSAPAGAIAAWPLVPGISDDPELWHEGCARLARAGIEVVQSFALAPSPAERRRLAELAPESAFFALFHRPAPPERSFARVAAGYGLAPFFPRPLPRPPWSGASNRRLAGALLLASELWLSLGRPVGRGLALARAARWIDESRHDVAALAREGNLALVPEVDEGSRQLIESLRGGGTSSLVEELLAEYSAGAAGDLEDPG